MAYESSTVVFDSAVGPVLDVTPRGGRRLARHALAGLLCGPALLFAAGATVSRATPASFAGPATGGEWLLLGMAVVCGLIGWLLTAVGIVRIRQLCDERIHFRAGPGGVDLAQPGKPRARRLFLGYRVNHWTLPWSDITNWRPYTFPARLIPVRQCIVFQTVRNARVVADLVFFSESVQTIARRLTEAADRGERGEASDAHETLAYFPQPAHGAPSLCARGHELAKAGELTQDLECFEEAVAIAPEYGLGWSDLGVSLFQTGRLAEAESALRKATELAPDNLVSWACLGAVCLEGNRPEEARRCLEACRHLKPDDSRTEWLAGKLAARTGGDWEPIDPQEAIAVLSSGYEEPYAISPSRRTVELHYVDDKPAWRVFVQNPQQFRNVESRIAFSLFKLRTGALLAYWLRLYDLPDQPYFVHRVLDISSEEALCFLQRMAAVNCLLVILATKGGDATVTTELPFEGTRVSALIEEGLAHNRGVAQLDGDRALLEFMAAFNESMRQDFDVGHAWQVIRRTYASQ